MVRWRRTLWIRQQIKHSFYVKSSIQITKIYCFNSLLFKKWIYSLIPQYITIAAMVENSSSRHHQWIKNHPNLIITLLFQIYYNRRLKKNWPIILLCYSQVYSWEIKSTGLIPNGVLLSKMDRELWRLSTEVSCRSFCIALQLLIPESW